MDRTLLTQKDITNYWLLSCSSWVNRIIQLAREYDYSSEDLELYFVGLSHAQQTYEMQKEVLTMLKIGSDFASYSGQGNFNALEDKKDVKRTTKKKG